VLGDGPGEAVVDPPPQLIVNMDEANKAIPRRGIRNDMAF